MLPLSWRSSPGGGWRSTTSPAAFIGIPSRGVRIASVRIAPLILVAPLVTLASSWSLLLATPIATSSIGRASAPCTGFLASILLPKAKKGCYGLGLMFRLGEDLVHSFLIKKALGHDVGFQEFLIKLVFRVTSLQGSFPQGNPFGDEEAEGSPKGLQGGFDYARQSRGDVGLMPLLPQYGLCSHGGVHTGEKVEAGSMLLLNVLIGQRWETSRVQDGMMVLGSEFWMIESFNKLLR